MPQEKLASSPMTSNEGLQDVGSGVGACESDVRFSNRDSYLSSLSNRENPFDNKFEIQSCGGETGEGEGGLEIGADSNDSRNRWLEEYSRRHGSDKGTRTESGKDNERRFTPEQKRSLNGFGYTVFALDEGEVVIPEESSPEKSSSKRKFGYTLLGDKDQFSLIDDDYLPRYPEVAVKLDKLFLPKRTLGTFTEEGRFRKYSESWGVEAVAGVQVVKGTVEEYVLLQRCLREIGSSLFEYPDTTISTITKERGSTWRYLSLCNRGGGDDQLFVDTKEGMKNNRVVPLVVPEI